MGVQMGVQMGIQTGVQMEVQMGGPGFVLALMAAKRSPLARFSCRYI